MSVIFGRWNFDGDSFTDFDLHKVRSMLRHYGPDGESSYGADWINILHYAFHTTPQSSHDTQPAITPSGAVLSFDGRLDNRQELIKELTPRLAAEASDSAIAAAAYEQWNTRCFGNLIGDWALSIWDPRNPSVILAKDPIGSRHLYYARGRRSLVWSTMLDPLVALSSVSLSLDEQYLAGWFVSFPATDRTPYVGIQAVSPAHVVHISRSDQGSQKYWSFDPDKKVRYRKDTEYEEHFRAVFATSVQRRICSNAAIVAELSGGVDSSAIVCVADQLSQNKESPLQTVSFYDDSEADWDERPYFTAVEQWRGRSGCHINAAGQARVIPEYDPGGSPATPWCGRKPLLMDIQFADCLASNSSRVVLSGIGGDEVLGGVPNPTPELADLLISWRLPTFGKQVINWAIARRVTVWQILADTGRAFSPGNSSGTRRVRYPRWIRPSFVARNLVTLSSHSRLRWTGPRPSFQENMAALELLRCQLACMPPASSRLFERRYPYLDRDLLEFAYAIPRDQITRFYQRRSLMRRALVGIVPDEILNRRRKAVVVRRPRNAILEEREALAKLAANMLTDSLGIVDAGLFRKAIEETPHCCDTQVMPLVRTLALEMWLRSLNQNFPRLLALPTTSAGQTAREPKQPLRTVLSAE